MTKTKMTKKRLFFLLALIYPLVGLLYYYRRNDVPFEITWTWLWSVMVLSFMVSPLAMAWAISQMLPDRLQNANAIGCLPILFISGWLAHNLVWTLLLFAFGGPYEDTQVRYPAQSNKRWQIITQYKDQGAIGEHYRTIRAYELTPFLRYIDEVSY